MRSKTGNLVFGVFFALIFVSGINAQSKNDKTVVGKVGKQKVTYGELKNNIGITSSEAPTLDELEDFLPIYLDYRAKLLSAKDKGYFDEPGLLEEFDLYSKQAAYSYFLENKIKPTEFDRYYQRATKEVKSEHVLIALDAGAAPSDTLKAYNSLLEARDKFLNEGITMSKLNEEYSSRRNGQLMGGDLPWLSTGVTVSAFEDVLYSLDKGELSMPFRTQFGYHIVLVTDTRERSMSRLVSHIFFRNSPSVTEDAGKAHRLLSEGSPWENVVVEYSMDQPSKPSGSIGWVNYGRYAQDFVDTVMAIDASKPFTEPVQTAYGYHIFRIDSVQQFSSEEEKKASLMDEFLNSPNYKKSNSFIVNWLKDNMEFKLNEQNLDRFTAYLASKDSTSVNEVDPPSFKNIELMQFNGESVSIERFHKYLVDTQSDSPALSYSNSWLDSFIEKIIDGHIVQLTTKEFPDFENELENYKNGLAVYKINEENVWSAETVDSTALWEIYNNNPETYSYPDRYHYYLISSINDSVLTEAVEFVKQGNSPDSIRTYHPRVSVLMDSTGVFTEEPYDKLESMTPDTFSEEFEFRRRSAVFYLQNILPARKMTFDESFGRLLAEYQPVRESKWLEHLRKEYKVKPDLKKLRRAFNADQKNN